MRPVNLIPPEERRGDRAPSRTGALAYILIGALALALLGVVGVVLTDNQISDRKAQVADLHVQVAQATAEANRLQSYASFATMESARNDTVTKLAQSRFDWYRVLRELALVIPNDVWLSELKGSVSPGEDTLGSSSSSTSSSSAASALTGQIAGPSLTLVGCAAGHDSVARFLGALRDIDGVTRVVVTQSERSDQPGQAPTASAGEGCAVRNFIAQFQVIVAFDKVPIDPTTGEPGPPPPTDTTAPVAAEAGGARHQEQKTSRSVKQQEAKAHQAISVISGTVRP